LTATETIHITVDDLNRPPVLAPIGDKTVQEGEMLTFTVSASDPDGTIPTLAASPLPTDATFITDTFVWTPGEDAVGIYTITFSASDGYLTDTETIHITVNDADAKGDFIYLPLVLRDFNAYRSQPLIDEPAPEVESRDIQEVGETFYTRALTLDQPLPETGWFYFSSDPYQVLPVMVDDQLALVHNGSDIFTHTFSAEGVPPTSAIVEVPRDVVATIAEGGVILKYRDVYGHLVSATEMWLVHTPIEVNGQSDAR
jgi:hypothetical protein